MKITRFGIFGILIAAILGITGIAAKTMNGDFVNLRATNLTVSGTTTISGTPSFGTKTANFGFMGPTTGSAAVPTFRALVAKDIDGLAIGATTRPAIAGTTGNFSGVITATGGVLGAIDGIVGGNTPAAGSFTALNASGDLELSTGQYVKGSRFTQFIVAQNVTQWTAPAACKVISGVEVHNVVCDAADVFNVEKLASGQAPGAGGLILTAGFTLNTTVNVPITANAVVSAVPTLAAGDSICGRFTSGDGTNYVGVVTLVIEWL